VSAGGPVGEEGKYPPLDEGSFTTRPIRFTDTGETAEIAVIDGEPVALAPNGHALEEWAERMHLKVCTEEWVRDMRGRDFKDRCWERFTDRRLLGRLLSALFPSREAR
jgi:hypothetical protein